MKTRLQDYDDWTGMLDACSVAVGTVWNRADVLAVLNGSKAENYWFRQGVQRIATALCIDLRARLPWETANDGAYVVLNENGTLAGAVEQLAASKTWTAHHDGIMVTDHPTAESAMEHLERMRGQSVTRNGLPRSPPSE